MKSLRRDQPAMYQVKVQGRLCENWSSYFDEFGVSVECGAADLCVTTLTGVFVDQAALHSVLTRVRDLGLLLMSVQRLDGEP